MLLTCYLPCLLLGSVSQLVGARPSGTELHLPEPFSLSRDHLPNSPHSAFTSLASIRDRTIDAIWRFIDPTSAQSPPRRRKGVDALPHLHAQYANQLVLRFNISTDIEAASLAEAADVLFLDVWAFSDDWVDLRIDRDVVPSLIGLLPVSLQNSHTPLMTGHELVRAVAESYPPPRRPRQDSSPQSVKGYPDDSLSKYKPNANQTDVFFEDYRPLNVITHWMRLLESLFHTYVHQLNVGETDTGRPIQALRVGAHPSGSEPRKTILITAGSHAREWISTSTVTYIMYNLIVSYGRSKSATRLLDEFDWVFVPTLNPDGYEYTWVTDRLWRKNRQATSLRFCRGVDLDRTWPYKWDGAGSTTILENANPCSESYPGADPFEAIESRSFAAWAKNETESGSTNFIALLDLHSYSEQILYPFSYSCSAVPTNIEDLAELGEGLAKAIRGNSRENYKVLSACEGNVNLFQSVSAASGASGKALTRMEGGTGSMLDWFYHELDVKRAFQIKLRDKGSYGFLLPAQYIVPTGEEILRAVERLGKALSDTERWVLDEEESWDNAQSAEADHSIVEVQEFQDNDEDEAWDNANLTEGGVGYGEAENVANIQHPLG